MVAVTGESLLWADSNHSYRPSKEREGDGNKSKESFHGCVLSNRRNKIAQRRISIS